MELEMLALHGAVLAASLLQAATGIGFGVLAGPVILMVMGSGAAVQVTILLSLLIALVLSPGLWRQVDRALLVRLVLGTLAGLPIGIFVFLQVSVDWLKLLAALAVLFMALSASGRLGKPNRARSPESARRQDLAVGVLSGTMSTSLAMPGPIAAAHMAARAQAKDTIRATILVLFVVSYTAAFALQALLAGVATPTLGLTATLVPATLVGVLLGRFAVAWVSEGLFRRLIVVLLATTAVGLLANALPSLLAAA